MNTTAQIRPSRTPRGRPTFREMLAEIDPLIEFVPAYGPPVVFVLGPWLFLGLMLAGPFACLVALVVVIILAATVVAALTAAIVATLAAPYLVVRRHRARRASISRPAAQAVAIESPRVAA